MPNHGGDDVARFANRRPAARFLKPGGIAILRIQRAPGSKKQHDLTSFICHSAVAVQRRKNDLESVGEQTAR